MVRTTRLSGMRWRHVVWRWLALIDESTGGWAVLVWILDIGRRLGCKDRRWWQVESHRACTCGWIVLDMPRWWRWELMLRGEVGSVLVRGRLSLTVGIARVGSRHRSFDNEEMLIDQQFLKVRRCDWPIHRFGARCPGWQWDEGERSKMGNTR